MAALQVCVQRITNDWCILFCVSFGDTVAAPFTAMISTPDCGIDTGGHSMSRSISPPKKTLKSSIASKKIWNFWYLFRGTKFDLADIWKFVCSDDHVRQSLHAWHHGAAGACNA